MTQQKIRNIFTAFLFVLILVLSAGTASAANYCSGGFAHYFYGNIDINSVDAPAGTEIRSKILGEVRNSYTTTAAGVYGNENTDDKFGVSGRNEGYDPNQVEIPPNITFEIFTNNAWTQATVNTNQQSVPYECSATTNVNLNVAAAECSDSDGDGVCNDEDQCPDFDDSQDTDGDGNPNGCDACPDDNPDDSDGDGSCDIDDICQGQNDFLDSDGDGTPDCLDFCPQDSTNDLDEDEVCGQIDNCPDTFNPDQSDDDNDDIGNDCDVCTDADEDGFCAETGDCVDTDPSINPAAEEDCDNVDNDCDANTPDGADEPGYGDQTNCGFGECAAVGTSTCVNGDMTDTCQPGPQESETCDGLDNDCNDVIDNGVLSNFFQDFDTDTYGNPIIAQESCEAPEGYVANNDDCNDNDADIKPGAEEVCDDVDNDCDGQVDEGGVCGEGCQDEDEDGVCDDEDLCEGSPNVDDDNDGICNEDDACPVDPENDADGDNVCEIDDVCPGFDDSQDTDGDGIPNGCDACPNDEFNDIDQDTLCGNIDVCPANPENDADGDGQCENLDTCPLDAENDADADGICGDVDQCPGEDDSIDVDGDDIPDCIDEDIEDVFEANVQIYDGWTLFALPFDPGVSDSQELGDLIMDSAGISCDVIQRFDGLTQQMQDDLLVLADDPSFAISGTEGYFIHCDESAEFSYQGTVWV